MSPESKGPGGQCDRGAPKCPKILWVQHFSQMHCLGATHVSRIDTHFQLPLKVLKLKTDFKKVV